MLRPMIHGKNRSHMIFKTNYHLKGSFDKNKLYFNLYSWGKFLCPPLAWTAGV